MARVWITKNAKRPRLSFTVKKADLIVKRFGLGEQPQKGVKATAGDRIRVVANKCDVIPPDRCIRDGKHIILPEPGNYTLRVIAGGKARKVKLTAVKPPTQNPREMELYGPGIYQLCSWDDAFDWIDRVADAGLNYIRPVLASRSWLPGHENKSLWPWDGKYDIERVNRDFAKWVRALCWHARARGVVLHLDLFDWHFLRTDYYGCWTSSEFNGKNNKLNYPVEGQHYHGRWENAVEHPLKPDWDYGVGTPGRELQERYANGTWSAWKALNIPEGHILGDGNELESRSLSLRIFDEVPYGCYGLGNNKLRDHTTIFEHILQNRDAKWVRLLEKSSFICIHKCSIERIDEVFALLIPLLQAFPHLKVLFSSDGWKYGNSGKRDHFGRPPYIELWEAARLYKARMEYEGFGQCFGGYGDMKLIGSNEPVMRKDCKKLCRWFKRHPI